MQLIEDKTLRERMGKAAHELSERNRGATARSLERIAAVLRERGAARVTLVESLLWPLTLPYGAVTRLRAHAYRKGCCGNAVSTAWSSAWAT